VKLLARSTVAAVFSGLMLPLVFLGITVGLFALQLAAITASFICSVLAVTSPGGTKAVLLAVLAVECLWVCRFFMFRSAIKGVFMLKGVSKLSSSTFPSTRKKSS
jgi:membrane glycosyltransferase